MTYKRTALLVLVLMLAVPVHGSGPSRDPYALGTQHDQFATVDVYLCTVIEIAADRQSIVVVVDDRDDIEFELEIADDLPIKAKKKGQFGGRKELEFSDFAEGQRLRITVDRREGYLKKIRVL